MKRLSPELIEDIKFLREGKNCQDCRESLAQAINIILQYQKDQGVIIEDWVNVVTDLSLIRDILGHVKP